MTRLQKPSIDLPLHRAALRRALLVSPRSEASSSFMFRRLLPAGLALALLFTVTFALRPQAVENTVAPKVSAEEIAGNALDQFNNLTPEQLQAIQKQLDISEAFSFVEDARTASDLSLADVFVSTAQDSQYSDRILISYSFTDDHEQSIGVGVSGSYVDIYSRLIFLVYSTNDYGRVFLGVDPQNNDRPYLIEAESKDGKTSRAYFLSETDD